ncbi:hypothetical protein PspS04_14080 [Pseudomonas sp. S04]|nr:hypothetical protein PspS04_14080 [Pseudomonas sp. S04]QHF33900.1 hypothetical protein PspS19_14085 [Pseudomonas sp. S19]
MLAMVVNVDAHNLMPRTVLATIAGKPAPTGPCIHQTLWERAPACGLLAMVANDDAHCLMHHVVLATIAGKPAPTGPCIHQTL